MYFLKISFPHRKDDIIFLIDSESKIYIVRHTMFSTFMEIKNVSKDTILKCNLVIHLLFWLKLII